MRKGRSIDGDLRYKERYCKYCGKRLELKFSEKTKEWDSPSQYNRRIYCDRVCMRKGMLKPESEKSKRNTHISARRTAALFKNIDKCELCGKKGKLDVHHKDEDEQNNDPGNLQILCRSCHMKIHRPKPICKVKGCGKAVKGYGYCEKHYQRFKKYGDPQIINLGYGHIVRIEN